MKLLKRVLKSYLIYSAVILLISIPLSYFVTRALCLQDVDEALQNRKQEAIAQIQAHPEMLNSLPWNDFTKNTTIYPPVNTGQNDKIIIASRYNQISEENEPYRVLHSFIRVNKQVYPITLRISLIDIEDLIQGVVLTSTLLIVLILGGLFLINRRQSKKIWQPFYQILNQLKAFNLDQKPNLKFTQTNISEFEELQQSILALSGRVYNTYLQQKEFTGNAAHELQTPLAAIQAKLELLIQDKDLTEKQSSLLQPMAETVIKMTRLNKALLLLTKIDNQQFIDKENIQVASLIKKLLMQSQYKADFREIKIETNYDDFTIRANTTLIEILLSNLINNALRYSTAKGILSINVANGCVEIKNDGLPLPFSEDKLFQRFQKGSHSGTSSGNGLGLAIVKKICDTCNYTISYNYLENKHIFTLNFTAYL